MVLLGLIEILYQVGLAIMNLAGIPADVPTSISTVWNYAVGLLENGKAILALFLDLSYMGSLLNFVFYMWIAIYFCELVSLVLRLIKLNF